MKATKTPSGKWRCRVTIGYDENGKQICKSITRATQREAIADASAFAAHHHEVQLNNKAQTLEEAITAYIERKSNILSPTTAKAYKSYQRNRLQPEMKLRLDKLTYQRMQTAINREAREVSPKTVKNLVALVNAVLADNGMDALNLSLPQKIVYEANPPEPDDIVKLIDTLRGDKYELPILFALALGLRRSEIAGLRWEDYDPIKQTISVRQAKVSGESGYVIKQTKTTLSQRTLKLPPYMCSLLDIYPRKSELIYTGSPDCITKALHRALDRAGIEQCRLHDLRHANASVMLLLNIADKYAMERGGWSSPQTMKGIYQHTFREEKENADNVITGWFEERLAK